MTGSSEEARASERKRDKMGEFLQETYNKGELALKHGIGLGKQQQVIPVTEPITNGPPRPVEVGWHPVGGFAGKWFAEKTGLGKMISEKVNKYPDPTQHWAVLVGDFAHQLWMDEDFHVIYTNERVDTQQWMKFQVGETTFNDDAIRRSGEMVIQSIRDSRPGYNLITNNCQTYVLQLLDAIKVSDVKEFATTLAVYDRLLGPGKVADLFPDMENHAQEIGSEGQMVTAPIAGQEVGLVGGTGSQDHVATNPPPAVQYDPGNYPPENYPPANYPPGNYPSGNYPSGNYPPAIYPPAIYPPAIYPHANNPPGNYQPGGYPPGNYQPGHHQPGNYQPPAGSASQQNTVLFAQQVMNDNTPQLDCEEEMRRNVDDGTNHSRKSGGWKESTSSLFRKFKKKDKV
ncbi:hypothetical protein BCR34DRAFT_553968 [Clohesyomyces aquaticus]|uniref:PPPDE domain-containing protein n=1 Tax=Clohesyomyces aquaticus TaxID=1231657 RepID=A0A1Y2A8M5_9PLEO|nr:hypothetical protein BCR34DRAFT_553968 [Clohesyomyces aquaticus]